MSAPQTIMYMLPIGSYYFSRIVVLRTDALISFYHCTHNNITLCTFSRIKKWRIVDTHSVYLSLTTVLAVEVIAVAVIAVAVIAVAVIAVAVIAVTVQECCRLDPL